MMLASLDFILIGVYFFALIIIGYFSSRGRDEEDYLIAQRNLGSLSTMATVNASKTGSILMLFVAMVYLWGFSAIWYLVGMVLGMLLFIPFSLKLKKNSKGRFYTLADYFKYNYGKKSAWLASGLCIFMMLGFFVINLIAGSKIFMFFTGWEFWICAIVMMGIILFYLLLGGFGAVVKTDVLQYFSIMFIIGVLAVLLFDGAMIPISEWSLFTASIGSIVGFFIVGFLFPFSMPELWQRVYSSRNLDTLKKGFLSSALIYLIVAILLSLIALTIKVNFPSIDPDLALIQGLANLLPVGLRGLSVVMLFSAIMSSLDTYVFTAASSFIQDFFKLSKKYFVLRIRQMIFFFVILGTLIAILIKSLVVGTYIFVAAVVILGSVVVFTWVRKRVFEFNLVFGFFCGILGFIFYFVFSSFSLSTNIVLVSLFCTILGLLISGFFGRFIRRS